LVENFILSKIPTAKSFALLKSKAPAEQLVAEQGTNPAPWSVPEQKALEQALKTFPSTVTDRWERIAECIPTRSKKDCMVRYKELVEIIQAKKKAQEKA
jgi:DnaJ family protein C protein 2